MVPCVAPLIGLSLYRHNVCRTVPACGLPKLASLNGQPDYLNGLYHALNESVAGEFVPDLILNCLCIAVTDHN